MLNDIIIGISNKLSEAFGEECAICAEPVKQGLQEPYFAISCVNSVDKPMLGARHLRANLFSVKYFPKSKTQPNAECNDVSDNLFLALTYITVDGGLVRGTNMNSLFVGGVLEFMVGYDFFVQTVKAIPETELMETLIYTA